MRNISFHKSVLLICGFSLVVVGGYTGSVSHANLPENMPSRDRTMLDEPRLEAKTKEFSLKIDDATKKSKEVTFEKITKNDAGEDVKAPAIGVVCLFANTANTQKLNTLLTIVNPPNETDVSKVTFKTTDKASNDKIEVKCSADGTTDATITISKIEPEQTDTSIEINGSQINLDKTSGLNLLAEQEIDLRVKSCVRLEASSFEEFFDLDLSSTDKTIWKIKGKKKSDTAFNLTATCNGVPITINGAKDAIPVRVINVTIPSVTLGLNEKKPVDGGILTFDPDNLSPTVKLKVDCGAATKVICGTSEIKSGNDTGSENILLSSEFGSFGVASFVVNIVSNKYSLAISAPSGTAVFVDGGKLPLFAIVKDEKGTTQSSAQIKWSLVDNDVDKQYVNLPKSDVSVQVTALKAPSDNKAIRIKAEVVGQADATDEIAIVVQGKRNVVDFKPIEVRIDMLDQRTASDLFGGVASKEYRIAKIRIVNDLPANRGGGAASSILFFSDSLELRVALEKKCKSKNCRTEEGWNRLTREDIAYINNWEPCNDAKDNFERNETLTRDVRACEFVYKDEDASCTQEIREPVVDNVSESEKRRLINDYNGRITKCKNAADRNQFICKERQKYLAKFGGCGEDDLECQNRFKFCTANAGMIDSLTNTQWIPFRPFIYQVVANTHDRRDERSLRSRLFLGANFLASGTSFFTSFLTLKSSNDLPLALEKYQNLLIPTMQRLFPSMREVQRQNIITEILPPLVELPFGSDVSKYVFFPKGEIEGILPEHDVRIVSISSYNIKVRVGLVQKGTLTQVP